MNQTETPEYGKVKNRSVLDEHGSTVTEAKNFYESGVVYPVRRDYEYRYPCEKTDIKKLEDIAEDLLSDPAKLDTFIKLDKRAPAKDDGKYYIVACYTKLVY